MKLFWEEARGELASVNNMWTVDVPPDYQGARNIYDDADIIRRDSRKAKNQSNDRSSDFKEVKRCNQTSNIAMVMIESTNWWKIEFS